MAFVLPVIGAPAQLARTVASIAQQSVPAFELLLGHAASDAEAAHACEQARRQLADGGLAAHIRCVTVPGDGCVSDIANALLGAANARFVRVLEPGWTIAPFAIELEQAFVRAHAARASVMLESVLEATDTTPFAPVHAAAIEDWRQFADTRLLLEPIPAAAFVVPREAIARGVGFPAGHKTLGPWSYPLAIAHDAAQHGRRLLHLGPGLLREAPNSAADRLRMWQRRADDHRNTLRWTAASHLLRVLRPYAPAAEDAAWLGARVERHRAELARLAQPLVTRCADRDAVQALMSSLQQSMAADPVVHTDDLPITPLPDWAAQWTRATQGVSAATLAHLMMVGVESAA